MPDYTLVIIMGVTLMANYLFLFSQRKTIPVIVSGIITIAIGIGSYLFAADNNPYGLIVGAIGIIVVVLAPWGEGQQ